MANPSHPYHELRNAIERTSEVASRVAFAPAAVNDLRPLCGAARR
jgi:hypothetical protein